MAVLVSGVFCFVLGLFLLPECTWGSVFLDPDRAHSVLVRTRRANSFMEELRTGNLERECIEEKCSYEEAREIFPQRQTLEAFWTQYQAGNPCDSAPCQNGATCTRLVHSFTCKCALGYHGHLCDKVRTTSSQNCRHRNGGCEHFCSDTEGAQTCSCADGFRLGRDNASCSPTVEVPCGRHQVLVAPRVVNGQVCPRGLCPWQALLTENHVFICGAVLLSPRWVLTAAHCVFPKPNSVFHITVGEHNRSATEHTEQKRRVVKVLVHPDYNPTSSDSDLALLQLVRDVKLGRYVVPVCLPGPKGQDPDLSSGLVRTLASVRLSTVSGWGRVAHYGQASDILQRVNVPRVRTLDCRAHTRLNISRNMLCFGLRSGGRDSCEGDSGGPLVTRFKKTWFLTGIVSWGRGCAEKNQYGVYTRVPNYLPWIYRSMEDLPKAMVSDPLRGDTPVPPKVEASGPPRGNTPVPPKAEASGPPRGDTYAPSRGEAELSPSSPHIEATKMGPASPPRANMSGPPRGDTSASPRAEVSGPPRAEVSGPPRGDTSASPRAEVSVPPRAEVSGPPGAEVSGPPRGNTSASPRAEVSGPPRAEVSGPPRGNTSASPRAEMSVPPRAEVSGPPGTEVSGPPRGNTSASPRAEVSVPPK